MGNYITDLKNTFKYNFKNIFLFELVYRVIFLAILSRISALLLNWLLHFYGYSYLTVNNVKLVMLNPLTYPVLGLINLVALLFSGFELSVLFSGFRSAANGQHLKMWQLLIRGIRRMGHMLHIKNLPLFLFQSILFYVFQGFVIYKLTGLSKRVLDFARILDDINVIIIIYLLATFILIFFVVNVFSVCYGMFGKTNTPDALSQGRRFWKKRIHKILPVYLSGTLLYMVMYYVIYSVLMVIMAFLVVTFAKDNLQMALIEVLGEYMELIILYLLSLFTVIIYSGITVGVFYHYEPKKKDVAYRSLPFKMNRPWKKRTAIIVIVLVIAGTIYNIVDVVRNGNLSMSDAFGGIAITAHRGLSYEAPENTLPALELAIDNLADYAEIDVRQTEDKVIVLMHDDSLYRTTGIRKKVSETTYDELKNIDAGGSFSRAYAGTKIPTLQEALELCKGKINLNIEIKRNSKDDGFIRELLQMVEEMDMEEQCVFSSTSYAYLKEIKEINDEIRTGYIISAAFGNYFDDHYVDFFSVNSSYLSESVVSKAHGYGKEVHAWTVNDKTTLNRMKRIGVDSVITDKPVYAREVLYGEESTQSLVAYIKMLLK